MKIHYRRTENEVSYRTKNGARITVLDLRNMLASLTEAGTPDSAEVFLSGKSQLLIKHTTTSH